MAYYSRNCMRLHIFLMAVLYTLRVGIGTLMCAIYQCTFLCFRVHFWTYTHVFLYFVLSLIASMYFCTQLFIIWMFDFAPTFGCTRPILSAHIFVRPCLHGAYSSLYTYVRVLKLPYTRVFCTLVLSHIRYKALYLCGYSYISSCIPLSAHLLYLFTLVLYGCASCDTVHNSGGFEHCTCVLIFLTFHMRMGIIVHFLPRIIN